MGILIAIIALPLLVMISMAGRGRERASMIAAMLADGFTQAEIDQAMRLHGRGDRAGLEAYCRAVIGSKARADFWSSADAYLSD